MTADTLVLQRQLSTGDWINCSDRTAEFLARCAAHNSGIATTEDAVAALLAGRTLRNHAADWYSNCRAKPALDDALVETPEPPARRGTCPNPRDCGDPSCRGKCGY